jgi:hypothetical protein
MAICRRSARSIPSGAGTHKLDARQSAATILGSNANNVSISPPSTAVKVSGNQIIGTSGSANIDLRCGSADQIPIGIEGIQKPGFIGADIWLYFSQCAFVDEERCFDGAIVSPKSHGTPRLIIGTTVIWEINHVIGSDRFAAVSRP